MITGIDVSYAQGLINWDVVAKSDLVQFCYVRATSNLATDLQFKRNWEELRRIGTISFGAYHFYQPTTDPVQQAEHFYSIVGDLEPFDLPPVIDIEVDKPKNQTYTQYIKNVRLFIEKAELLFKRRLVIYTGGPIFNDVSYGADKDDLEFISEHPLWLAAYVKNPNIYIPNAWTMYTKTWSIWQKSGDIDALGNRGLKLPGITANVVDYNQFHDDITSLQDWIRMSHLSSPLILDKNILNLPIDVTKLIDESNSDLIQNNVNKEFEDIVTSSVNANKIVVRANYKRSLFTKLLELISNILDLFKGKKQ